MAIGTFFFHLDPDLPGDHFCCPIYLHLFVHIGQRCIWGTFSIVVMGFFPSSFQPPSIHRYRLLYMSGQDCMVVTKITEGFMLEPFYAGFNKAWSRYFVCLLAFFIAALYDYTCCLFGKHPLFFFTCLSGLLPNFVLFFDLCAIFSCLSVSLTIILLESPAWRF